MKAPIPACGESEQRNADYMESYSPDKFYKSLVGKVKPVIFDIGAHQGESVRFFKEIYPDCTIYSFEPIPENFSVLRSVAMEFGEGCITHQMGIADKEGRLPFYRQSISHLGGFLRINNESKDSLGYASKAENEPIEIEVSTIDKFCYKNRIEYIDILKIDTQGYEIGVLNGAKEILRNTTCCTVEVSLYDFYEKSSSLYQVDKIMATEGHKLWDISNISKNPKNYRTDWVELVYVNSNIDAP